MNESLCQILIRWINDVVNYITSWGNLVAKRHVRPFEDDGYSGATNEKRWICERSRVNYQHPKI